jgi:hypothetical protein
MANNNIKTKNKILILYKMKTITQTGCRAPKTHADYTDYPRIFNQTYWGAFQGEAAKDINDNRNNFVKEFHISRKYKTPKYMFYKISNLITRTYNSKYMKIDHMELYKTKNNTCVIVNSPYYVSPEEEETILNLGFCKYPPLYNNMALTYITEIPILK